MKSKIQINKKNSKQNKQYGVKKIISFVTLA